MTLFSEVSKNWKSGLTVALVSVPLSLSLAIASNATPVQGIITAVWAGLVAALLGGSRFNVIGPAGALSGILTLYSIQLGVEVLPLLAVLTGVVIFGVYLLRWDKYLVFIPGSVMHGFTLSVGLIIGLNQLNFALGLKGLPAHESLLLNIRESLLHAGQADPGTIAVFAVTLATLFLLLRYLPRIPGAVAVAVPGMGLGYLSHAGLIPLQLQTVFSKYGALEATLVHIPSFAIPADHASLAKAVVTVAVVAVLETLLSAKIADGMTKTRFDQKKEVFGLAAANVASGLAGGLPATGVLARTALNIKTGASSRVSSGLNALFVLLVALLFFPVFQYLPLAVVAGILVYAAIRMVEIHHFRRLLAFDKFSFGLALMVAALSVAVDPMAGILVGAVIALLVFAKGLSRGQSEITLHKKKKMVARVPHHRLHEYDGLHDVAVYRFAGELTYFNGRAHEEAIKKMKADALVFSLRNLFYLDLDGMDALQEIVEHVEASGKRVVITGAGEYVKPMLEKTAWFRKMEKQGKIFSSSTEALDALGFPLGK